MFQEVRVHPSRTRESTAHVSGGGEAGPLEAGPLPALWRRAGPSAVISLSRYVFGDISSDSVLQMSMQLANWQDSWEEPQVVLLS